MEVAPSSLALALTGAVPVWGRGSHFRLRSALVEPEASG